MSELIVEDIIKNIKVEWMLCPVCGSKTRNRIREVPGNWPYRKGGGAGLVPKATKECVSCGLCAENCPAQAISRDSLKTADPIKCISCMRCVAGCPRSARKVKLCGISE